MLEVLEVEVDVEEEHESARARERESQERGASATTNPAGKQAAKQQHLRYGTRPAYQQTSMYHIPA